MGLVEQRFHDRITASEQQKAASPNGWVLTAAQSLGGVSSPIIISLGGLVSQQLAFDPAAATLPVSMLNLAPLEHCRLRSSCGGSAYARAIVWAPRLA
ncbi:hypothetical protein [Ensifer aridi]|uniref:hypothetical protein n=1 Tax=Ensifer aridi TaxID=1708715 RepID=UPI0009BDC093|nr:hypothetical protein [Ensifer aridi]